MAYRWRGKNFEVDPDNPRAEGICDRCGMRWNLDRLQWQYSYQGAFSPMNTRYLVCPNHVDPLNPQDQAYILPPDPLPVFNARPEPYTLDETSWLTTEDDSILATEDGDQFITAIPNPSSTANTSVLASTILYSGGSVATAYLDLFDGDPAGTGRSVLSAITGSSTRTDISSQLTTVLGIAQNTSPIVIATASASQTNISYAAIYSAAADGVLLASGTLSASPTIADGNPVQFNALGLQININ